VIRRRVSIEHWAKSGTSCQLTFTLHYYLPTRHRRFDVVAMANYHYDESGVMASYFLVSILFIILIPSTYSLLSSFKGSSKSPVPKSPLLNGCWHSAAISFVAQRNHKSLVASVDHVWINESGYASERGVHCWGQKYQNCTSVVGNFLRSGLLDVWIRAIFVALGWALFAFLVTRTSSTGLESKIYDPYEILGIKQVCGHCCESP
jgi:translocation protein SEC63